MTTVIALTGPAGSGKDSVADVLCRYAHFARLAFADALKAEAADAFGARVDPLFTDRDSKEQPTPALALHRCGSFGFIGAVALATHAKVDSAWLAEPRSPRQILQWWGTEFRRRREERYWVHQLVQRIGGLKEAGHHRIVVTDCRFPNELQALRMAGAKLWRVQRAGLADVEGAHISATALAREPADALLDNNGTLDTLRDRVLAHWLAHEINVPAWKVHLELQP